MKKSNLNIKIAKYPSEFECYSMEFPTFLDVVTTLATTWKKATPYFFDLGVYPYSEFSGYLYDFVVVLHFPREENAYRIVNIRYQSYPKRIIDGKTGNTYWVIKVNLEHETKEYGDNLNIIQIGAIKKTPLRSVDVPNKGVLWAVDSISIKELHRLAHMMNEVEKIIGEK